MYVKIHYTSILFRKKCIFYGDMTLLIYLRDQVIPCLNIETSIGQNDSNMSQVNKCIFPAMKELDVILKGRKYIDKD